MTNIHETDVNAVRAEVGPQVPFRAVLGDKSVAVVGGWAEGTPEVFCTYGPDGFVQVVAAKTDASKALSAKRGDVVGIVFGG